MNKKLLAIAVSTALVVPASAVVADVFVYGHAQVEVASYSEDSTGSGMDGVSVEDNSRGRFGVKASEDLGNGLKAIAQFEWKVDTTDNNVGKCSATATIDETVTGTDINGDGDMTDTAAKVGCSSSFSLSGRVSQVGLTGGFGTFVLGNLKSPYKYAGGVKYDPFVATSLQARRNGGMSGGSLGHNGFLNDLVVYASPKGPFTASIGYGPSEDDGLVVFDVKYSQGGMEAFVAYLDAGDRLITVPMPNAEYSATKIGGQWKSGAHKISGQYEMTDNGTTEPTVLFLGYQIKMGKNTFALQYGDTDPDTTADNTTYVALGVIHKMSKMTRVFAGYRDTSDVESVVTVGLRKDFKS